MNPMAKPGLPRVSRAFVVDGSGRGRIESLPMPLVGDDEALVRMEGVYGCAGGDTIVYSGRHPHSLKSYPLVLGHEGVGVIAAIGADAARRRGLSVGDRVAVEVMVPCDPASADACDPCRGGDYQLCERNRQHGVSMPLALDHGLWGMYADYLAVHPLAITHRIPANVTMENAVATAFLANAVRWTHIKGQVQRGEFVAVFGPGPQGVGSCAVATHLGATPILIGISADDARFEIATRIGVVRPEHCIRSDREDLNAVIAAITANRGCDLSIECSGADAAVPGWLDVLRKRGRGVLCGYHGGRTVGVPIDRISTKELTILGAWGQAGGFPLAIEMLEREVFDFTPMITQRFTIEDLNEVIPQLKDPSRITMKALICP